MLRDRRYTVHIQKNDPEIQYTGQKQKEHDKAENKEAEETTKTLLRNIFCIQAGIRAAQRCM